LRIPLKEGIGGEGGERKPKKQGEDRVTLPITLLYSFSLVKLGLNILDLPSVVGKVGYPFLVYSYTN